MRFKVFSYNEDCYVYRFNAESDAHARMQWEQYEPSPVAGCICWEMIEQVIKD